MKSTRWITCAAFALLCTPAAFGQSEKVLGSKDAEFAQRLLDAGYNDLAKMFSEVLSKTGGPTDLDQAKLLRINLSVRLADARNEEDVLKRRDLLVDILKDKRGFIDQFPRAAEADEERAELPDLYAQIGEAIGAALENEADPQKASKLRDQGQTIFTQGTREIEDRVQKFADLLKNPNAIGQEDYFVEQLLRAKYNLARTLYFNSRLYSKDDPTKKLFAQKALEAFQEFGLDYGDLLVAYEGLIYEGLIYKDMGKTEDALAAFDDVMRLRENYEAEVDGRGVYPVSPEEADTLSRALLQKVLLFKELGEASKAKETVDDFFATVQNADQSSASLALLAALAEVQLDAGDTEGATATANRLNELDPNGVWGARGRELLGKLINGSGIGGISAGDLYKVSAQMYDKKDYDRARQLALMARAASRGSQQEAKIGGDAYLMVGYCFWAEKRLMEAAVAFDALGEELPTADQTPEGLYQAAKLYQVLASQEKRPFYRKRYEDRMSALAQRFPNHPRSAEARMLEGDELVDAGEYSKAAEFFSSFKPGTPGYEVGLIKAGEAYQRQALDLLKQKKAEEAATYFQKAADALKLAQAEIEKVIEKTLDRELVARMTPMTFLTRLRLAEIALNQSDADAVFKALVDVEKLWPDDGEKIGLAWGLRIRALVSQNKFDEAIAQLESLRAKDPSGATVAQASGELARALDTSAVALFEKDPKSAAGEEQWKRAATYYWLSVQPALTAGNGNVDVSVLSAVALRLYIMGLHFAKVPTGTDTFITGKGTAVDDPSYFERAASIYQAALANGVSYEWTINLGRSLGFLARWKESADVFAGLFDQNKLIDESTGSINNEVLKSRTKLLFAYLDWGVAEHMAGLVANGGDKERLDRAATIFERVLKATAAGEFTSPTWWGAKYYQVRSLFDGGKYSDAALLVRNIERNTNDFDGGKYGYNARFKELKDQLAKKGY